MRRAVLVLVLLGAAAAVAARDGRAVHPGATLSAPPAGLTAGARWVATLTVRPAPARAPSLLARHELGWTRTFAARRVAPGRFRVTLVLEDPGRWTLTSRVGGRAVRLRVARVAAAPPPPSPLPGTSAYRACGGAKMPYPQYSLALGFGSAWLACRGRGEVERLSTLDGRVEARIRTPVDRPWTVVAGAGAVWTVAQDGSVLVRIDPSTNRVAAQVALGAQVPYIWSGAGAVWAADDDGQVLLRVDPAVNRVVARVPVGNGPSGFFSDGAFAWVLNHRENTLDRVDVATNNVTRLATGLGPADTSAAERIASAGGSLWVTGRGLDLLRLDPATGTVTGRTEIGPAGIDVVSASGSLWLAAYDAAAAPRGDPVLGVLHRIDPVTGLIVSTAAPARRTFVSGLASDSTGVWVHDEVAGLLIRIEP